MPIRQAGPPPDLSRREKYHSDASGGGFGWKCSKHAWLPAGLRLVRSIPIPPAGTDPFDQAHDLAQDPSGNVYIYDGTFTPALAIYHAATKTWSQETFPYWNTVANTTYGGLTYYQGFVYATDNEIGNDPPRANGIVRFNIGNGTAARFFTDNDFINVNMGLDGKLYALRSGTIDVIDPITMSLLGTVNLHSSHDIRGVAVTAAGDIFTANLDNSISHFEGGAGHAAGKDCYNTGHYTIDIDVASDGTVVVGTNNGLILQMTSAFTNVTTTDTGSGSAIFVKFATPTNLTIPPVGRDDSYATGTNVPLVAAYSGLSSTKARRFHRDE